MEFRIADTFTDSLARLTGDEQKAVKTTAFDLQMNPANPGMQFHKLDKAKDKNFWSVRVSGDIRLIVHKSRGSLLLCYVDHHDKAYDWAERGSWRRIPRPGPRSSSRSARPCRRSSSRVRARRTSRSPAKLPLFAGLPDDDLLGYGVPPEWLADVRRADEDSSCLWPTTCRAKPPRRCWSWPPAGNPVCGSVQPSAEWGSPAGMARARPRRPESVRSSRRAAPVPRDDQRRGA